MTHVTIGFVEDEWQRWQLSAAEELEVATANRDLGYHNVAVLHAGQAIEHTFKGLLLGVGAVPARTHDLLALADDCAEHAALELEGGSLRDALRALTRDHNPSRYPDAVPQGTPRGNYGRSDADRAITAAAACTALTKAAWLRLRAAAEADPGDGEGDRPCR